MRVNQWNMYQQIPQCREQQGKMRTKQEEAVETEGTRHIGKVELGTEIENLTEWKPSEAEENFVSVFSSLLSNLLNNIYI